MSQSQDNTQKDDSLWLLTLFLVNPFFSLVFSVRNYLSKYSKNIILLFCGFYGYTFYPVRETMDSFRHRENFLEWVGESNLTFDQFTTRLYGDDVKYVDVFMPLLKFVVSRFTDSPSVFYGILGLLFGFYFSRNIWTLIEYSGEKLNRNLKLTVFTFAFIIGPWEINSFRFWIAAHIFVYYSYRFLVLKQNRHIIGLLVTPFIHFGFFFSVIVFGAYKLIGNRPRIYLMLLAASLVLNNFPVVNVQSLIPQTSLEGINKKTSSYTSEGYIEDRAEAATSLNWYVTFKVKPLTYTTFLFAFLLFLRRRKELLKSDLLPLFCFTIFLMAISFAVMGEVPTFFRYFRLSLLLFYGFLFLFLAKYDDDWYKRFYGLHLVVALFYMIVEVRIWFDTATIDTFISNPIIALISQTYICMINFIK
ncbi:hypothetical protein HYN48_00255 [Flavobacterium magnum]|uniref:EpsG family protein n=1 Tax=Flavobacterium magnum TaxID=2162713 RepID=A0A2S0R9E1_9FLAO|nr:hypothetical protein [Flavobacterium magnum]AWA28637.1 hypothetical protein HYN48_00255 [Flavobacterium magnum]